MDQSIFHAEVCKLVNEDSHWQGSGNRSMSEFELNTLAGHLWELFQKNKEALDLDDLTRALLKTAGKYMSEQERAEAIIQLLSPKQKVEATP